ncbi:MAG TPA: hypothetical protein VGI71_10805 [Scandinavium sp.]|jgi:type 1 fimbria pilin
MSFNNKISLAAICVAAMISGSAMAATNVGTGTVTVNGTIGAATCTVVPSKTTLTVPAMSPTTIQGSSLNAELNTQSFTFNMSDCGSVGDVLNISVLRDVAPPTGTGSQAYSGGFTYAGGAATASATGPIYYKIKHDQGMLPLTTGVTAGSTNYDISTVADKSSFTIPMTVGVYRAPANGVHTTQYSGTYAANIGWTIAYP